MMDQEKTLSPEDRQTEEFVAFIHKTGATSADIESAYLHLCGVKEDELTDPKVKALYEEMERLSRNGFPINRFASTVEVKDELENGAKVYLNYLNTLPLSDKEIQVLYSVVTKKRAGEVELFANGDTLGRFETSEEGDENLRGVIVKDTIEKILRDVPEGKKITISFTEK